MTTTKDLCLGARAVECACDTALHRPVLLDPWFTGLGIRACLCCGAVTVTACRGDDGRYTGVSSHAYFKIDVPEEALAWLRQWPRARHSGTNIRWPMAATLVPRDVVFIPAETRCQSKAELERLEERLAAANTPAGRRPRELATPISAPPPGIPEALHGFVTVWQALRLGPDADVDHLLRLAQLGSAAGPIAVDLLLQHPDADHLVREALRSSDGIRRSAGIALARAKKPVPPKLDRLLIELIENLGSARGEAMSASEIEHLESLLVLIADLKLAEAPMLHALRELRSGIARQDPDRVDHVEIVLGELTGQPPVLRRTGFLP